jgi:predicted PurR-regulated permease PerM
MRVKEYPFYLKSTFILFGLILLVYILFTLGDIIVPVAIAAFMAVLLNPLYNRLLHFKLPVPIAALFTLLIAVTIFSALFYFLSAQVYQFGESFPLLKNKLTAVIDGTEKYIYSHFGVSTQRQVQFVKEALNSSQEMVGKTLGTVLGTVSVILLVPVYIFMMLLYKKLILNFLYEVFSEEHSKRVGEILQQTKAAVQSYIVGLLIEMIIIAILNSTALLVLGVRYAILIGVIGAILNMLPLIGGLLGILLAVLMATVTKDGFSTQIAIIVAYTVIQFIDNNIIFPRFVSVKVQINALISIIAVLLGNALWGMSGMFLSLPCVAVLKIIFDRVDELKPWGKLLGDEIPLKHMGQIWIKRRRKTTITEEVIKAVSG